MSYEQCVHKPDLKSFHREIWAQALLWPLWGWLLLLLLCRVLVAAISIKLHPGVISLLLMGWREMTVVSGCSKKAVCLEEVSWIAFDLCSKWAVEILGTLTQKNRKHAFSSSNGLQEFNLFFFCWKGKSLSISMPLNLAFYYFWIVLAEARHTCHAWLYNFLPECDYSEKY